MVLQRRREEGSCNSRGEEPDWCENSASKYNRHFQRTMDTDAHQKWKLSQVLEALTDPKYYCVAIFVIAQSITNAGITNVGIQAYKTSHLTNRMAVQSSHHRWIWLQRSEDDTHGNTSSSSCFGCTDYMHSYYFLHPQHSLSAMDTIMSSGSRWRSHDS